MFFLYTQSEAAQTFKEILKTERLTYAQFAKKIGMSVGAINLFIKGRPLTTKVLERILNSLPQESARRLLKAHLRDEVARVHIDPSSFLISENVAFGSVMEELSRLITARPALLAQLVQQIQTWKDSDHRGKMQ